MRSPALCAELVPDGRVIAAMLAWLGACMAGIWAAQIPPALSIAATLAVPTIAWPVVRSQLFGLVRHAPARIGCNTRGQWFAQWRDGSSEELELARRSRVFPGALLLLFRGTSGARQGHGRWIVLLNRRAQSRALRRLRTCVTLELARRPVGGS